MSHFSYVVEHITVPLLLVPRFGVADPQLRESLNLARLVTTCSGDVKMS
jgi:hypothetical protein